MVRERKHLYKAGIVAVILLFLLWGMRMDEGERKTEPERKAGQRKEEPGEAREAARQPALDFAASLAVQEELHEIPALGYGSMSMHGGGDYACWGDMLVLKDRVYKRERNGFQRQEGTVYDLFGLYELEKPQIYGKIRQYNNLLVLKKVNTFLLYDMESGSVETYQCKRTEGAGGISVGPDWYIYEGSLYFMVTEEDTSPIKSIRCLDLSDKSERIFYAPVEDGWEMLDRFMMDGDGSVLTGFCDAKNGKQAEYRCLNREGQVKERTSLEYPYDIRNGLDETWLAYNGRGLFVKEKIGRSRGSSGIFCQEAGGMRRAVGLDPEEDIIFTEHGYFSCDKGAFYDFQGNLLSACFSGQETDESEYLLETVVYEEGTLTAFYTQKREGNLYVAQAHIGDAEAVADRADLWYWVREKEAPCVFVTPDEEVGNITGYVLEREKYKMAYVKKADVLTEPELIGKGIFVSEHMEDVEIFLAEVLQELLEKQGEAGEKIRGFVSDWAVQQLQAADWAELEGWQMDAERYDCSWEVNRMYAGYGYDFFYVLHQDRETMDENCTETEEGCETEVHVLVSVDGQGVIRGIRVRPDQRHSMEDCTYGDERNRLGFYGHSVQVIREGRSSNSAVLPGFDTYWDGEAEKATTQPCGLFAEANEDTAACAEKIETMLRDVLESQGEYAPIYQELFSTGQWAGRFVQQGWEQLETDWKAGPDYDCYFLDLARERGYVRFCYYFYPDFGRMGVDEAKAAVVSCCVDQEGKLCDTKLQIVSMTRAEYMAVRAKGAYETTKGQIWLIESGEPLKGIRELAFPLWGMEDAGEAAGYIGDRILENLNGHCVEEGRIRELLSDKEDAGKNLETLAKCLSDAGQKWKGRETYACWEITEQSRSGCVCFRYVFERYRPFQGKRRNLWMDVYVSEEGIEEIRPYIMISGENVTWTDAPEGALKWDGALEYGVSETEKALLGFLKDKEEALVKEEALDEPVLHYYEAFASDMRKRSTVSFADLQKSVMKCCSFEEQMPVRTEYAFLDCGGDGCLDLICRFVLRETEYECEDMNFVVTAGENGLNLSRVFTTWNRYQETLYYYGYGQTYGSGGIVNCWSEYYIGSDGSVGELFRGESKPAEELIRQRIKELGLPESCLEKKELKWMVYES